MILKGQMKSVRKGVDANVYTTAGGGLKLTDSYDHYTHTTETRRKIGERLRRRWQKQRRNCKPQRRRRSRPQRKIPGEGGRIMKRLTLHRGWRRHFSA